MSQKTQQDSMPLAEAVDLPEISVEHSTEFLTGSAPCAGVSRPLPAAWLGQRGIYRSRLEAVCNGEQLVDPLTLGELIQHAWCYLYLTRRAGLTQPSPAQAEKAEMERPEGSADLLAIVREAVAGAYNEWKMISEAVTEIMEAHERIVGELRAKADQLREALEWRKENQAGQRELLRSVTAERDAALARIAELESKLAELEMQAPVAFLYRGTDMGDRRRDLVKACALALAEIERLDRAAASQGGPHDA
ncbi:TPA: hypothetical protein L3925_002270 [Pseudomonas aeruginosa]|nr:hypothetical protein [Pseudomonas aeruginosa]